KYTAAIPAPRSSGVSDRNESIGCGTYFGFWREKTGIGCSTLAQGTRNGNGTVGPFRRPIQCVCKRRFHGRHPTITDHARCRLENPSALHGPTKDPAAAHYLVLLSGDPDHWADNSFCGLV